MVESYRFFCNPKRIEKSIRNQVNNLFWRDQQNGSTRNAIQTSIKYTSESIFGLHKLNVSFGEHFFFHCTFFGVQKRHCHYTLMPRHPHLISSTRSLSFPSHLTHTVSLPRNLGAVFCCYPSMTSAFRRLYANLKKKTCNMPFEFPMNVAIV